MSEPKLRYIETARIESQERLRSFCHNRPGIYAGLTMAILVLRIEARALRDCVPGVNAAPNIAGGGNGRKRPST
jgi:hypothetical protein